jgi:hypothetical protein
MERKKSMLRGEYKPQTGDGVGENEPGGAVKRSTSVGGAGSRRMPSTKLDFQELTINDLQRLEELAGKSYTLGHRATLL